MKKKISALLLALAMTLSLAACGGSGNTPSKKNDADEPPRQNTTQVEDTNTNNEDTNDESEPTDNQDDITSDETSDVDETDVDETDVAETDVDDTSDEIDLSDGNDSEDTQLEDNQQEDKNTDELLTGTNLVIEGNDDNHSLYLNDPDYKYYDGYYIQKSTWKYQDSIDFTTEYDPNIEPDDNYAFMNYITPLNYTGSKIADAYKEIGVFDSLEAQYDAAKEYQDSIDALVAEAGDMELNTTKYESGSSYDFQYTFSAQDGSRESKILTCGITYWGWHTYSYEDAVNLPSDRCDANDLADAVKRVNLYTGISLDLNDLQYMMDKIADYCNSTGEDVYSMIITDPVNDLKLEVTGAFPVEGEILWYITGTNYIGRDNPMV